MHGLDALQGAEDAIVGNGSAAALDVAERRYARVEAEAAVTLVGQQVLDVLGGDFGSVFVAGALGDDDNGLALAHFTMLRKGLPVSKETRQRGSGHRPA